MIYLDNAATTLRKPPEVTEAVLSALKTCANPGRGGYSAAAEAEKKVFETRLLAGRLFDCSPDRVCFTSNATEGLNIALRSLLRENSHVLISGLEHNSVTRTLAGIGAHIEIAAAPLFDEEAWIRSFQEAMKTNPDAVVCTHVSNVFGAILPVGRIAALCAEKNIPFVVDASQSAGLLPVRLKEWGAAFVAMPGHKGLFGPQGTGILLCGKDPKPLRFGGTGSQSVLQTMPDELPDRIEAGTLNVPGICGLYAGMKWLIRRDPAQMLRIEQERIRDLGRILTELGMEVYAGDNQAGVLSVRIPGKDPETTAQYYAEHGIALRGGLHCAPLAHQTAGTFPEGTLRISISPLTKQRELLLFAEQSFRLMRRTAG